MQAAIQTTVTQKSLDEINYVRNAFQSYFGGRTYLFHQNVFVFATQCSAFCNSLNDVNWVIKEIDYTPILVPQTEMDLLVKTGRDDTTPLSPTAFGLCTNMLAARSLGINGRKYCRSVINVLENEWRENDETPNVIEALGFGFGLS